MSKMWLKCALIRAAKTMAQAAVATIGAAAAMGEVDWKMVASASVLAGILSILTSVAGLPEVEKPMELTDDEAEWLEGVDPESTSEIDGEAM